MSFDATDRGGVAPQTEKQSHRLPAAGFFAVFDKVEKMIDLHQARIVDRLREAAKEHGEVAELLQTIAECFPLVEQDNPKFSGDGAHCSYLRAAKLAASFVALDRESED